MGCFCWQHWKCFEDPDIRLGKVFFLWNMQWSWIEWTKSKSNKLSWMKGFQTWIWNNAIFNQTCAFRIRIHKRNLEKGTRINSQDKDLYHSKLEKHKHFLILIFCVEFSFQDKFDGTRYKPENYRVDGGVKKWKKFGHLREV